MALKGWVELSGLTPVELVLALHEQGATPRLAALLYTDVSRDGTGRGPNVEDTIALAAMMQAVVCKLHKLLRQNTSFRIYPRRLIDENRWRASRYGLDGKLIDFGRGREVETRSLIHEILEFISNEVDELGSGREMTRIERILREGTGADRQLAVWERTQDMKAVVDQIVAETNEGLELDEVARPPKTPVVA